MTAIVNNKQAKHFQVSISTQPFNSTHTHLLSLEQ